MNPKVAFATVARFTIDAAPVELRRQAFESLLVIAEKMDLPSERQHVLAAVESMRASEALQMQFESLIRAQLSNGGDGQ